MMGESNKLVKILLVEDNLDDIVIAQKAFKEAKLVNPLFVVRDGEEALEFLHQRGRYQNGASSPRPNLILLDINIPKVNGLEVLAHVKHDSELRRIPVIMLTSSRRDQDVVAGYTNGCNSFLQKPVEFERFVELVKQVGLYWGLLNVSPTD